MQRQATRIQRRSAIRLQFVAQVQFDKSLFEALRLEQKNRAVVRCVPVARVKLQRMFVAQDRVVRALQQDENAG